MERYILEVKYVDKMHRTRKSTIEGVYRSLEEVQERVGAFMNKPKETGLRREYSVQTHVDPAHSWVLNH